jgi:RNA polymerase sigma-70 factor (ECF subfamily)
LPEDTRTDRELVEAANDGDEAAFEALYYRHRDWVARLAFRFTGSREDALDVIQGTFEYLLGKFPGFTLTATMTTFLYPVAKHLSINIRRKNLRYAPGGDALDEVKAPCHPQDTSGREELASALTALNEGQREVLLMRFVDGMTLEEIAGALAIPVGTVKSRLHNALETLSNDPRTKEYFIE